jgi:hypothetical protein
MDPSTRRILIILGVAALVLCLCIGVFAVLGGTLFFWPVQVTGEAPRVTVEEVFPTLEIDLTPEPATPAPTAETSSTGEPASTTEPGTSPELQDPTAPASELPEDVAEQMDAIEQEVIALRGLSPTGELTRALLTPAELREHVIEDFLEDYTAEEARDDALTLASFGLLEPDFDLYEFYIELFSEQVAGFYDDETKAMYVIQDQGFRGPQRLTYAHEYVHALQDLNYDMESGLQYSDEACEEDSERCAAVQALLEGDASFSEIEWFTNHATAQDAAEIQDFYSNYESPVYDRAPAFMREDFIFPYQAGHTFVEYLHNQGEWQSVDQAYENPPVSTEQILHPERYPDDAPIPVDLPELETALGDGWREIDRGVMGEWYTYLILAYGLDASAQLEITQAQEAAEGWGGDRYVVYFNEDTGQTVMVLRSIWESDSEAEEFSTAFQEYAGSRFGTPSSEQGGISTWEDSTGRTELRRDGDTTTWILAPDQETAQQVGELVQNP